MIAITLALLLFLFPLAYSPGPGNLFFAALGARAGVAATGPALAGYHLATFAVTWILGLGAGWMDPSALSAIRLIGAAYVAWLAVRIWRAGPLRPEVAAAEAGLAGGAALLLLNPKAYVIIALMLSRFPPSGAGSLLWIASVFTVNNLIAFGLYIALGDRLARPLRDSRALPRILAAMLFGVAIWLALG